MSRRNRTRVISYLATAFAVLGGFAIQGQAQMQRYRLQVENQYQHAFTELTTAVTELDAALQKGRYTTSSGLLVTLYTEGFERAQAAQAALGEIPYANIELEETAAFLGKTGDYLFYLTGHIAEQNGCSQEERDAVNSLAELTANLSSTLRALQSDVNSGALTLESLEQATKRLSASEDGQVTAGSAFQTMEADFPEMPSLLYDGPFSEHLTDRKPAMLEGKENVTEEEARNIAAEALGRNPEQLTLASDGGEALPSYGFATSQADGDYYIEVTHQGGEVSSFFRGKPEGETVLTQEEAVQQAKEYVERQGFDPLQVTYWISYGNTVTVNFAAVQDNILLYPDLVKVEVSQTDGTIVGVECAGYLANHRSRTLPSVEVSEQAARNALVPALSVQSVRLTLIPTRGEYEVLCYEFLCQTPEGTHCMIYVNAETGEEEKILLLLEDENGTLAQ